MYTIKKNRNNYAAFFTVLLILLVFRIIAAVYRITEEAAVLYIVTACVYGVLAVLCLLGLIRCARSRLVLNSDSLIYTPPLGAVRTLSYNDLEKVSIGGRSYEIYTRDGKKLFTFDDFRTENASSVVAFLKAKGVRTEI